MNRPLFHILVFARYPVPGRAKTRLIPAIGAEGASRLYRRMTEHCVAVARAARIANGGQRNLRITICYTGAARKEFRAWLGPDLQYAPQPQGNIGTRMRAMFEKAFRSGAEAALLVGSDLPELVPDILLQALDELKHRDVVVGPAHDGGYYLIGMKKVHSELFEAVDWGTGHVYKQTRDRIRRLGLNSADLPLLRDVDRPEDLARLRGDQRFMDVFTGKPMISVVIPTFNESAKIGLLLDHLYRSEPVECIVADGGSGDDTRNIAVRAGASVLEVTGGRALQQNAGASAANGRILLFLHADTLPPDGYAWLIRRALDRPAIVAGAFRFKVNDPGAKMRLVEWIANIRSTFLKCPYGDQGLFMEKRIFHEMGGFAHLPIMEDFELVRRLGHRGGVTTLPQAAVTSARRWRQLGVVRTTTINQCMILGFLAGMPIERLERFYRIQKNQIPMRYELR